LRGDRSGTDIEACQMTTRPHKQYIWLHADCGFAYMNLNTGKIIARVPFPTTRSSKGRHMSKVAYTSMPRKDPSAPWTPEEAIARIKHVLDECKAEYQFTPSPVDFEALEYLRLLHCSRCGGEGAYCGNCGRKSSACTCEFEPGEYSNILPCECRKRGM
jgi:hypothetical protein